MGGLTGCIILFTTHSINFKGEIKMNEEEKKRIKRGLKRKILELKKEMIKLQEELLNLEEGE